MQIHAVDVIYNVLSAVNRRTRCIVMKRFGPRMHGNALSHPRASITRRSTWRLLRCIVSLLSVVPLFPPILTSVFELPP